MMNTYFYIPDYFKNFKLSSLDQAVVTRHNALGKPMFMPVSINNWQLPEDPIINVQLNKIIVKTALAGNTRRGSVKQLINMDDYRIGIRGFVQQVNSNEYPEEAVRKLKELFEIGSSLKISCRLTDLFEIDRIVIESASFPEQRGKNVQFFEISALSDEDFILIYD